MSALASDTFLSYICAARSRLLISGLEANTSSSLMAGLIFGTGMLSLFSSSSSMSELRSRPHSLHRSILLRDRPLVALVRRRSASFALTFTDSRSASVATPSATMISVSLSMLCRRSAYPAASLRLPAIATICQ